jgi:conjugal transfer pilus assembly protein TraU
VCLRLAHPAHRHFGRFWEPVRLIDVTNKAWCFPNLGGISLNPGFDIGNGHVQGRSQVGGKTQN